MESRKIKEAQLTECPSVEEEEVLLVRERSLDRSTQILLTLEQNNKDPIDTSQFFSVSPKL